MGLVYLNEEKIRIDKYLVDVLDLSRSIIKKMIEDGYITVNGNTIKANYELKCNDEIKIMEGYKTEVDITPEDIPINIVFEDDDIIIVNKESGMVVHPGSGNHSHTLVNALMYHTNNLSDINGLERPGIVHRIDADTTGLMVVAKNNKAHQILADMLARHEIKREYIALLVGEFKSDTATIDAPIGRDEVMRKRMTVTAKNSKPAISHLRVLKRYKGYTLVRLSLETGRTHQIRVHMKYIGYPVYNDPVYGECISDFGQFLHSASIEFNHPITNKLIHFDAPLPLEFESFIKTLEELN